MIKVPEPVQLPSGSWRISMMINRKRISITAPTKRECIENARERKKAFRAEEMLPGPEITLREAIDAYISKRSNIISPTTLAAYHSYQRNHFQTVMDEPLSAAADWQSLINEEARSVSPKTLVNIWGLIEPAVREQGVKVPAVTLKPVQVNEAGYFAPDELKGFLAAIHGHKYEVPFLLGLHSLRLSEIYALREGDVTEDSIHIHGARVRGENGFVEKDENKTVKSRRDIPVMIPRLKELLPTFDWKIMECNPETWRKNLYRICRNNNLPLVSMQGLRHTFRTLCHYLKISELDCMRYGGWSDFGVMHKHYTHLTELERKESTEKLQNFFSGIS